MTDSPARKGPDRQGALTEWDIGAGLVLSLYPDGEANLCRAKSAPNDDEDIWLTADELRNLARAVGEAVEIREQGRGG